MLIIYLSNFLGSLKELSCKVNKMKKNGQNEHTNEFSVDYETNDINDVV